MKNVIQISHLILTSMIFVRRNRTGSPGGEKTAIKIERGRPAGLVKKS